MTETVAPKNDHKITLNLRCGTCVFFNTLKYKKYKDTCENLGVIRQNRPCKYYLNNARSVSVKTKKGKELADVMSQASPKELDEMSSLLNQEKATRRQGFKFGQVVYVRMYPGEYLSNYAIATIIQANKDNVYVEGKSRSIRGLLLKSSVFSEDEWVKKKRKMIQRKAYVDPDIKKHTEVKVRELPEEMTISFVEEEKRLKKEEKRLASGRREKFNTNNADLSDVITIRG